MMRRSLCGKGKGARYDVARLCVVGNEVTRAICNVVKFMWWGIGLE